MRNAMMLMMGCFLVLSCQSPNAMREPTQIKPPNPNIKSAGDPNMNDVIFDFMHTKPDCDYKEDIQLVDGGVKSIQHKPTWCQMKEDMKRVADQSGMEDRIVAMLDTTKLRPSESKVFVAYFSFSNKKVQRKICEISKAGVSVRVFLDAGSSGQIDDLVMNSADCKDANGKLNVKLSYLGGNTTTVDDGGMKKGGFWQLHHNKFMIIQTPGANVKINFSSGNLSSFGTSLHLDHWVLLEAPEKSNVAKAHFCVMGGLEAADTEMKRLAALDKVDQKSVGDAYISARENCFQIGDVLPRLKMANNKNTDIKEIEKQVESALQREDIAALFSPNDNDYVAQMFIDMIDEVESNGYVYVAIQHFLHQGVKDAFLRAAKRGVDIRMVMDDDALRGQSEVPNVDKLIRELDKDARIEIRVADTNKNAGGNGSMMHNKLAIINGKMTFSGAGHYTKAALRDNWENFYFITDSSTIKNYSVYFNLLWENSLDIKFVEEIVARKGALVPTKAKVLHPEFIKIIK